MRATFVTDQLTKWTKREAADGIAAAFFELELTAPTRSTLCILVAHWALETGWGDSCHCNNPANFKAGPTYEGLYTTFRCNEILKDPKTGKEHTHWFLPEGECDAVNYKLPHGVPMPGKQRFTAEPGHPQTRFMAFETAAKGIREYLARLKRQWFGAWQRALAGDPAAFSHALRVGKYYTANEAQYTKTMVSVFNQLMRDPATDLDTPQPRARQTIGLGAKGPDVQAWQQFLATKVTGDFDGPLRRLTIAWQIANGLKGDGVVGPKTWAAMDAAMRHEPTPGGAA